MNISEKSHCPTCLHNLAIGAYGRCINLCGDYVLCLTCNKYGCKARVTNPSSFFKRILLYFNLSDESYHGLDAQHNYQ